MTNKCKFNYRLCLDVAHSTVQLKSKIAETETGPNCSRLQQWDRSFDRLLHHKFVLGETFLAKHLNASGNFCKVSIDKYQGRGCVYHFVLWESFKAEATLWIAVRRFIFCYFWDTSPAKTTSDLKLPVAWWQEKDHFTFSFPCTVILMVNWVWVL